MKPIITTLALLITFLSFGQNPDFSKLDSYFMVLEEQDRFWGSVAVSRDGEIIYSKALGFAEMETGLKNDHETKFRIGSISKTFTATLIMKAVESGKLDLDDNIENYFPEIENASKITIRHLLNHQSGINTFTDRDYLTWLTQPITQDELLSKIVSKGVDFEPGTDFTYSNSNYVLLTFILEDVFNKPYDKLLEKHIANPLGLARTNYGGKINPTANEARPYTKQDSWETVTESHMSAPLGAGGIVSTPEDLCRFGDALFNGEVVSQESLQQMLPATEGGYGFALEGAKAAGIEGMGHGGDIDAFTSTLTYFAEHNLCLAITVNGPAHSKYEIADAVISEMLGLPYEIPTFEYIELTAEELDIYLGVYESDQLPIDLTIAREGNQLIGKGEGQGSFKLNAEGNHKFSAEALGLKVKFTPAEGALEFEQAGLKFEMTLKQSAAAPAIELTSKELDQYLGTYSSAELPIDLTISKDSNVLIGQGEGQPSFQLQPEGNHTFVNKEIGLKITFEPAAKKMLMAQGGASFEMTLD